MHLLLATTLVATEARSSRCDISSSSVHGATFSVSAGVDLVAAAVHELFSEATCVDAMSRILSLWVPDLHVVVCIQNASCSLQHFRCDIV
jgi:hypothetical protein